MFEKLNKFRLELGSKPFYIRNKYELLIKDLKSPKQKRGEWHELYQLGLFLNLFNQEIQKVSFNQNDPPDFIVVLKDNSKIGIEITSYLPENGRDTALFNNYYKLFNEIKETLSEKYSHLYGILHLKSNSSFDDFIKKNKNRSEIAREIISVLDKDYDNILHNERIDLHGKTQNILSKYLDEITVRNYKNENSNNESFFWWASHLRSGEVESMYDESLLYDCIETKEKKVSRKVGSNDFKELWLVIVADGFNKDDILIMDNHNIKIDKSLFDNIYVVSAYSGLTQLYSKN